MDNLRLTSLQHKEHQRWLRQLDFYQDEIKIFQNELVTVLHEHPNYLSIAEHIEEYRQIFLKKLERIDNFRHEIVMMEKQLREHLAPGTEDLWDHEVLRANITEFIGEFEKLKANFRRFVSRSR